MFKYLIFVCLALSCHGTVIRVPQLDQPIFVEVKNRNLDHYWTLEFLEFLKLIDVEKVLGVAVQYINDAEVMNFLGFIFGPDFKEIIREFESLEEFNEAYLYLADNGYDTKRVIDFINAALELPPYSKPKSYRQELQKKGMSGFIVAMLGALPLEEMRDLLEKKLTTEPEYAELMAILDSQEFMAILKKLAKNPKIEEFKAERLALNQ
ncbi:uncharacterized protein LOC121732329 [Aricia agestis]|uniref:uncharacterized protein LOC121732329 n=1 Tax=Aricia agestis TaxID=91739 RepID=UPI001C209858|nr:uncharacterized protein LOC121732329 [Aricia agestis]